MNISSLIGIVLNKIPFKKDLLLEGFFQSWKHFHHYRDQILEVFSPLKEDLSYLENKYKDLIDRQDTVAVHVRTYSSLLHRTSHPFVGLEYYQRSFDQFPNETLFVVFSDRIEWCKIHFPAFGKNIVFIDGNDHIQDLYLFSISFFDDEAPNHRELIIFLVGGLFEQKREQSCYCTFVLDETVLSSLPSPRDFN